MKANYELNKDEYKLIREHAKKVAGSADRAFMMGGQSAMKMAYDRFSEEIKNAETFEELQKHSFALLDFLKAREEGLGRNIPVIR